MGFGFFPNTGGPVLSWRQLAEGLAKWGYPGPHKFWSIVILATELIGGPLLILGLFTRPVSVPIFILLAMSVYDHTRDGWFWNVRGVEYPLIWSLAALHFLVNGGGPFSLDRLIGWDGSISGLWWGVGVIGGGALVSGLTVTLGRHRDGSVREPLAADGEPVRKAA